MTQTHPFVDFPAYPSLNQSRGNFVAQPEPFDVNLKDSRPPTINELITTAQADQVPRTIDYPGLLRIAMNTEDSTPPLPVPSPDTRKVFFINTTITPSTDPVHTHPIKNPPASSSMSLPDHGSTCLPTLTPVSQQTIAVRKLCDTCGGYDHGNRGQRCTNPHAQCNDMKWCVVPSSHPYYHNCTCCHNCLSHYEEADDNDAGYDAYDNYNWEA
jgi:hypothetical protein